MSDFSEMDTFRTIVLDGEFCTEERCIVESFKDVVIELSDEFKESAQYGYGYHYGLYYGSGL